MNRKQVLRLLTALAGICTLSGNLSAGPSMPVILGKWGKNIDPSLNFFAEEEEETAVFKPFTSKEALLCGDSGSDEINQLHLFIKNLPSSMSNREAKLKNIHAIPLVIAFYQKAVCLISDDFESALKSLAANTAIRSRRTRVLNLINAARKRYNKSEARNYLDLARKLVEEYYEKESASGSAGASARAAASHDREDEVHAVTITSPTDPEGRIVFHYRNEQIAEAAAGRLLKAQGIMKEHIDAAQILEEKLVELSEDKEKNKYDMLVTLSQTLMHYAVSNGAPRVCNLTRREAKHAPVYMIPLTKQAIPMGWSITIQGKLEELKACEEHEKLDSITAFLTELFNGEIEPFEMACHLAKERLNLKSKK